MFSGIIRKTTEIIAHEEKNDSLFLTFKKPENWVIGLGDSIATNGTCLTVATMDDDSYATELMPETLAKTTFGKKIPRQVNLEKSLTLADAVDGHLVTGHVDTLGTVQDIIEQGNTNVLRMSFSPEFSHLIAEKGSITVNGVSLTVIEVGDDFFTVSLVDYTWQNTTLHELEKGSLVNLEFDILAKYIARMTEK